jgi:maltose alpha-D-glucosyltransferase / alpha-amylase
MAELRDARVLSTDRLGASIAYGETAVLKLLYRMEEGTAPELEIARFLQAKVTDSSSHSRLSVPSASRPGVEATTGKHHITPRVFGYVERRTPRSEPITLALLQEYVVHEGTAWQHARSELGRFYERVIAHPPDTSVPSAPTQALLELSRVEPPEAHAEAIGAYRDWAFLLGRRTADLHIALASSTDPAFEPKAYSTMDQRSKYQSARNVIGRVLAGLRRTLHELPSSAREPATMLVGVEDQIMARFETILSHRIVSKQIRCHGDLHLGRVLFTGKDFVILGVGSGRDRRLSERRRKRGALRDVAGMIRSFHYAAATSLVTLRPEDQPRAERWGWIWQNWASAAFVRGYLETAKDSPFIPPAAMLSALLDAALLEKAFADLRGELQRRPDMAWIPMQGILRLLGVEPR